MKQRLIQFLPAVVFLLTMQGAEGQQAGSAGAPTTAVEATHLAKVSDAGGFLVVPELIPKERTINEAEPCKEQHNGVVMLSLVVDASGNPRNIAVTNPKGIAQEKLAKNLVGNDVFKAGTLQGKAVAVKQSVQVSVEACLATKTDTAGNTTDVFRLTAQPVLTFSEPSLATEAEAHGSVGDEVDAKTGMYRVGNGVSAPVPLNDVEAEFPKAGRKRTYGVCLVTLVVGVDGKPVNPRVIRSLSAEMDQKAVEAVNKYRFKPAMKNRVPVPVQITVEVNFRPY